MLTGQSHLDEAQATDDPGMTAFSRNVLKLMERIEYRRCEGGGEDLEDIFRLRYNSYLSAGMIQSDVSRTVIDAYEDLPTTITYGVYYDGTLVSTVRIQHASQEDPRCPSMKVFGDILEPRIAAGESFIDPSRFAADLEWSASLKVLPYITLRLPMLACRYFGTNACLQAIKGEHAAFYKRVFVAEPLVQGRTYPGLTCPVDLWQSPSPLVWQQGTRRFAFFRASPMEERMLFGKRSPENAPLTILPTAKYLSYAA